MSYSLDKKNRLKVINHPMFFAPKKIIEFLKKELGIANYQFLIKRIFM